MSTEDITRIGDPIPWFADADGEINVVVYKDLSGFSPCFPAVTLLSLGTHGVKDDPCANLNLAQLDALIGKLATARVLLLAAAAEALPGDHEIARDESVDVALPAPVLADLAALRDHLTTLVDAPRDAARAAAEVVHRDDTVEVALVKTSLGEWGVRLDVEAEEGGIRYETSWYTGDAAEVEARRHYNGERDVESCCYCSDEVDYGAAGVGGCEDGVLCPTCAEIAHEEWLASPVVCTGGFTARNENGAACGWRGKGADAAIVDGNSRLRECPTCGGEVDLVEDDEEVDEAAVAALTGSM